MQSESCACLFAESELESQCAMALIKLLNCVI